jgi:hypothetical protein
MAIVLAFSKSADWIIVVQIFAYCVAILYLLHAARSILHNSVAVLWTGAVLALSPLAAPWSQWVLTESLATAGTIWVMAECLRALDADRMRVVPVALALAFTMLMRWDQVWVAVPVLMIVVHLHGIRPAVLRAALILTLAFTPYALLVARAGIVGLPLVPPRLDSSELPPGIVTFCNTASIKQTAIQGLLWRVWDRRYGAIERDFDYQALADGIDQSELRRLMRALSSVPDGATVPPALDDSFAALAARYCRADALRCRVWIPIERAIHLWSDRDRITYSGWSWRSDQSFESARTVYRLTLLGLTVLLLIATWKDRRWRLLIGAVLAYVACRTLFLTSVTAIELRYLAPMIPPIEFVAAFASACIAGRLFGFLWASFPPAPRARWSADGERRPT